MVDKKNTSQGNVKILAEAHDNVSAFAEARNIIKESDDKTTIMLESRTVLNGTIEAFYEGKISKKELETALKGFMFQEFAKRAGFAADVIEEAKNKGIPVIAYDTREIGNAVGENKTTIDSYINRKTEQLKKEMSSYGSDIIKHRDKIISITGEPNEKDSLADIQNRLKNDPDNKDLQKQLESKQNAIIAEESAIEKIQTERHDRREVMLKSMEIIKDHQDSKYNPIIEKITRENMASGIYNQDIISAKAISALQNKNNIIIAGEFHVSGADARESTVYGRKLWASGILDEALQELGHPTQVFSIRESAKEFINPYGGEYYPVTREKYDGYLIVNKEGKHLQSFKTQEELQSYVEEHVSEKHKTYLDKGKAFVGLARDYDNLPEPQQYKEFATLLAHIKDTINLGTKVETCSVEDKSPNLCTGSKKVSTTELPNH